MAKPTVEKTTISAMSDELVACFELDVSSSPVVGEIVVSEATAAR